MDFLTPDTLEALLLAISLSAAAGFRLFVPFVVLSGATLLGHVDLPSSLDWMESPTTFVLFAIALLLEVIGYSIPWFDHALDLVATPAAVLAGTVLTGMVSPELDPLVKWSIAIAAGGGTAGLTKGVLNLLRGGSTAVSGGLLNPLFAALEGGIALLLALGAVLVPAIAGLGVFIVLTVGLWRGWQWVQQLRLKLKPSVEP
jgi:hypothetical protein